MHIRCTNHAQIAMLERGISGERVADALRNPDDCTPERAGAFGCVKRFGVKTLKVIFRRRGAGEYVIITAYYL